MADENIPSAVVRALLQAGHDAAMPSPGSQDPAVAEQARVEGRVLLTQDKHLANVLKYPPSLYSGIIRLRIHPPLIEDMLFALEHLFKQVAPQGFKAKLFVVERDGFRIRE